jgi:hypothetical protein
MGRPYTNEVLYDRRDVIYDDLRTDTDEGKLLAIRRQEQMVITRKTIGVGAGPYHGTILVHGIRPAIGDELTH